MASKQSPFYGIEFGWTKGEDNWNVGMDDNLVKLGFFSKRVIDSFETVLPALPAQGQSCVLPDNSVNFYVDKWYTISPTDEEIYTIAGKTYKCIGGVFVEQLSADQVQQTLSSKIDKISAGNQIVDLGTLSTNTTINLTDKYYITAKIAGDVSFTFNDTPTSGEITRWTLELEMLGKYTVSFPATVWNGGNPPILGSSGKNIINFTTTPTSRFGSAEVQSMIEASQGVILGAALVVPSTNPSGSSSSSSPPDVITSQDGKTFLKEGKIATISDATYISNIRTYAPWLEVKSFLTTFPNITYTVTGSTVTGTIVDYIWEESINLYIVLAFDVSGTGAVVNRLRILTTSDFTTFNKTTGLDSSHLYAGGSTGSRGYYHLRKGKTYTGESFFYITQYSYVSGSVITYFHTTDYTSVTWVSSSATLTTVSGSYAHFLSGYSKLLIFHYDSTRTDIAYPSTSYTATRVLGVSSASPIVSADYDGVSKFYMSLENGTIIDQTNTSIGISFVGATGASGTTPTAPSVLYVPELSGWFAIETNTATTSTGNTYTPRVFFRPDSTQVWGQIGSLPAGYKTNLTTSALTQNLVYFKNKLILFGLTPSADNITNTDILRTVMVSSDGGITWTPNTYAELSILPSGYTGNYIFTTYPFNIRNSVGKNRSIDTLYRVLASGTVTPLPNYYINIFNEVSVIETNNTATNPTVTTAYTRII